MSAAKSVRRRWLIAAVAFVLFVGGVTAGGVVLGPMLRTPEQVAAESAPPAASLVLAKAEKRVVSKAVRVRGRVEAGAVTTLTVPSGLAGASAVVTAVPVAAGDTLREGSVVVEIAGEPLFALHTAFPFYRDITAGDRGPDVAELERALRRLGYSTDLDAVFEAVTQQALAQFYADRGYRVPRRPRSGPSAPPTSRKPDGGSGTSREEDTEVRGKPMLPRSHVIRIGQPPHEISAVRVHVGSVLRKPDAVLLELDRAQSTVSAVVEVQERALISPGEKAVIHDDVRGTTAEAVVESIAEQSTRTETGVGYAVRLRFTGEPMKPTPEHTVRITIGGENNTEPVLAVPYTAVYSRPDGSTYVTIARDVEESARPETRDVTVRTGRTADGWVRIVEAPPELKPGTRLVVGWSRAPAEPSTTRVPGEP